ncbi:hypothetical protein Misp01_51950 [Microtetraspora sp. NBRC 13810]|nr:hypothetical protein [Microtetraspora sp. NBRC 13810]GLW10066.1 hypothetical protein Misp01_51950 [Microtetraspora sp. NBRC 13810]
MIAFAALRIGSLIRLTIAFLPGRWGISRSISIWNRICAADAATIP